MTKRMLGPVGQAESHATMSVVRGLARDQGSLVRLLRVVPVPELVMGRYGRTIAYVDQEMERLTAQGLEELMCPAAELEGVPVERVVRFGEPARSEEHTSELQSQSNLVCRLLLEKKKTYPTSAAHATFTQASRPTVRR